MSNEIVIVPFEQQLTLATAFAKSGLFGVKTEDQALALMAVAQAYGLHPARAATEYHIINGRPSLKADALQARFQAAGGSIKWLELSDKIARAEFSHPQGGNIQIEWTMEMAQSAGLPQKNPTWKSYPRAMLRSRVISEGVRTVYPGVTQGMYTPEEVQDMPAQPQQPRQRVKEMGEVQQAPDKKAMLKKIAKAETLDDLEGLRPEMRLFDGEDKLEVMGKAKERAEAIRAAAEPVAEPEQNGGDLV